MRPSKLHKRPTRSGLWHPVSNGVAGWPLDVDINVFTESDENGVERKVRVVSVYQHGSEERRTPEDFGADTLWLRYRSPKVTR